MKSAGYGAAVEWHQDWAFYPYTNDDVLAVGLIIDDMVLENGPLMVFPGTHKLGVFNHHHNGVFAGAMDLDACGLKMEDAVPLMGPARLDINPPCANRPRVGIEHIDQGSPNYLL